MNDQETASLRIHQFLPTSHANGPGVRATLWVQGCTLGCPRCFNPETHSFTGSQRICVTDLFDRITSLKNQIEGITISGGEPFQQQRPLHALLRRVKEETSLSVLVFSGYTWTELQRMREAKTLLDCIVVLIAGRYDATQHLGHSLLGSANQTIHLLTERYTLADLQAVPQAEVIITPDGDIVVSGINPVRLESRERHH